MIPNKENEKMSMMAYTYDYKTRPAPHQTHICFVSTCGIRSACTVRNAEFLKMTEKYL